jgi:outer membrane receptor protein involved in Fe transport
MPAARRISNNHCHIRGLWKYTGERDNTDASAGINGVLDEFEAYNLINVFTGWRASDYRWDVSAWVKNLLDEDEITFQRGSDQFDITYSGGSYTQPNVVPERSYGLTARYSF